MPDRSARRNTWPGRCFEQLAKAELTLVPYKGGGLALNDVIAGQAPEWDVQRPISVVTRVGRLNEHQSALLAALRRQSPT